MAFVGERASGALATPSSPLSAQGEEKVGRAQIQMMKPTTSATAAYFRP